MMYGIDTKKVPIETPPVGRNLKIKLQTQTICLGLILQHCSVGCLQLCSN